MYNAQIRGVIIDLNIICPNTLSYTFHQKSTDNSVPNED